MSQRTDPQLESAVGSLVRTIQPRDAFRRAERVDRAIDQKGGLVNPPAFDSAWDGNSPLLLGGYHIWIDATGDARIKNGKATSDTDGSVIGGQS